MSDHDSPSRQSAKRIIGHVKLGFLNFADHWQEWIVPMLVAAAIWLASIACCYLPLLFVSGPITCGLYWCAMEALRDRTIDSSMLKRGWETAGSSIAAQLILNIVCVLPILLLYACVFALFIAFAQFIPSPPQQNAMNPGVVSEGESRNYGKVRPATAANPQTTSAGQTPASGKTGPQQSAQRPPTDFFLMMGAMVIFYLVIFVLGILFWVWSLWFATRTMFVFPLIAHRRIGFFAAFQQSWAESRNRFWELMAINFIAGFVGMAGMYLMYVGMIATIPISLTILVSAYKERFGEEPALANVSPAANS